MKEKTYTKRELVNILLSMREKMLYMRDMAETDAEKNYIGGKADAYKMTACFIDKISIKERK